MSRKRSKRLAMLGGALFLVASSVFGGLAMRAQAEDRDDCTRYCRQLYESCRSQQQTGCGDKYLACMGGWPAE